MEKTHLLRDFDGALRTVTLTPNRHLALVLRVFSAKGSSEIIGEAIADSYCEIATPDDRGHMNKLMLRNIQIYDEVQRPSRPNGKSYLRDSVYKW